MDWNQGRNCNLSHLSPEQQQYLLRVSSAAGNSVQTQAVYSQNSYNHRSGDQFVVKSQVKDQIIKKLLTASTTEDFFRVQQSLMASGVHRQSNQNQVNVPGVKVPYNSPTFPETIKTAAPAVDYRNTQNVQVATPNYRRQSQSNVAPMSQQSSSVGGGSPYGGSSCGAREVQFSAKNYQGAGSFVNSQPRMQQHVQNGELPYYTAQRPNLQPAQRPNLQPAQRPNLQPAQMPNLQPAQMPNLQPAQMPNLQPAQMPNLQPAQMPNLQPAQMPNLQPAQMPNLQPAQMPNLQPAQMPNLQPAQMPNLQPAQMPNLQPAQIQYLPRLPNMNSPNQSASDLQKGTSHQQKWNTTVDPCIATRNTSECAQSQQSNAMQNFPNASLTNSSWPQKSSESVPANMNTSAKQCIYSQAGNSAANFNSMQQVPQYQNQVGMQQAMTPMQQSTESLNPGLLQSQNYSADTSVEQELKKKQEYIMLYNLYLSVKSNLLRIVNERKLQKQSLQGSEYASQETSRSVNVVSGTQTYAAGQQNQTVPMLNCDAGQQKGLQAKTFQMNSDHAFPPQDVYAGREQNITMANNLDTPNNFPPNARNISGQNYSLFDGGQNSSMHLKYAMQMVNAKSPKEKVNRENTSVPVHPSTVSPVQCSLPNTNSSSKVEDMNSHFNEKPNRANGPIGFLQRDSYSDPQNVNASYQTCGSTNILQSSGPVNVSYGNINASTHHRANSTLNATKEDTVASSLEALETCLALWKSSSKNENANSQPALAEQKSVKVMAEKNGSKHTTIAPILSSCEALLTSGQKQDTATHTAPKGTEPQIAIVSPLIKAKTNSAQHSTSTTKVQCPVIEEGSVCSLSHIKEKIEVFITRITAEKINDVDVKSPLAIEKGQSETMLQSDSLNVSPKCKSSSSQAFDSQVEFNMDRSDEEINDTLQIASICSLAEGNSFYDSSIAMIFDDALQPDGQSVLIKQDTVLDVEQKMQGTKATDILGSVTYNPSKEVDSSINENLETDFSQLKAIDYLQVMDSKVDGTEDNDGEHSKLTVDMPDSNSVTDQLTELLTEFPFGIKNYMSENSYAGARESLTKEKSEEKIVSIPVGQNRFDCLENSVSSPSNIQLTILTQEEIAKHFPDVADTLSQTHEEPRADCCQSEVGFVESQEMDLNVRLDLVEGPQIEQTVDTCQNTTPIVESQEFCVSFSTNQKIETDLKNSDGNTDAHENLNTEVEVTPENVTFNEDLSDKNVNQETDTNPKNSVVNIFPDEDMNKEIETKSNNPVNKVPDKNLNETEPKEKNSSVNKVPDKNLFCCLFSWLTHAYGSAPKCACKVPDGKNLRPTVMGNKDIAVQSVVKPSIKISSSNSAESYKQENIQKPLYEDVVSSNERNLEGSQDLNCDKYTEDEFKSVDKKCEPPLEKKRLNSIDERNFTLNIKPEREDSATKLIIKTDFLKTKHFGKEKLKRKEGHKKQKGPSKKVNDSSVGFSKHLDRALQQPQSSTDSNAGKETCSSPERNQCKLINISLKSFRPPIEANLSNSVHKEKNVYTKSKESTHFAQTKKVLTIQEYLQRKRERDGSKKHETGTMECHEKEKNQSLGEKDKLQHISGQSNYLKRKSSAGIKSPFKQKDQPRLSKTYSPLKKNKVKESISQGGKKSKQRSSDKKQHKGNGPEHLKTFGSSKDKIYLSPCVSIKRTSHESISLTKLEFRPSPEQPIHKSRRKSCEPTLRATSSNPTVKKQSESPKMLEFKLFPELLQRRHSLQDRPRDPKTDTKDKCAVEGIKSKKEAWFKDIPFKKRKLECLGEQGKTPSTSTGLNSTSAERDAVRQNQDSKNTFNTYKKMYLEKRCRSLDVNLAN
ncbi:retroelement silencing factor 1 [Bombina bombina]|uniref:retroelement silencing factor 1 n=1 Tax=Bombina bombina TaxID=8345 RepID=UPI00235AD8A5|nr:retroelement silencing factor 1 [Bombina bombina]